MTSNSPGARGEHGGYLFPVMITFEQVQNEQQTFEAAFALKRGTGEFEGALIGALNARAGCPHTLTFDKRALRMPHVKLIA